MKHSTFPCMTVLFSSNPHLPPPPPTTCAEPFEGLDLANQWEKPVMRTHDQYSNVQRKVKQGKNNP